MAINSPELSKPQNQPEMAWFYGVGYKGKGITYVTTSKQFDALFPDYIEQNGINPYGVWCSCDGGIPDQGKTEEVKNFIVEAERALLEKTGFSAAQIQTFHAKLLSDYRDKTEAPFSFQLFDPTNSSYNKNMEASKESERFKGTVRPFREDDISQLRKISEHWLQDDGVVATDEVDGDMATLMSSLDENSGKHMLVAQTQEGNVVGMMGLAERPKEPIMEFARTEDSCELIVAYVHPDFQGGQGVGTALINANQNLARSIGKKEILLESGPRHKDTGYPFYDKQPGFNRVGIIPNYYGPGADTVVWQKIF